MYPLHLHKLSWKEIIKKILSRTLKLGGTIKHQAQCLANVSTHSKSFKGTAITEGSSLHS